MLKTISWNQFLTFWAIALTGYYALVLLGYYRRELTALLNRKVWPASTEERNPASGAWTSNQLMGSVLPENTEDPSYPLGSSVPSSPTAGMSLLDADQLVVSVPHPLPSSDALLVGTVADLLEEIKTLSLAITEGNGTKEEFLSLFEALFARYQQLIPTPYPKAINLFVLETGQGKLPFELTLTEINRLWPKE